MGFHNTKDLDSQVADAKAAMFDSGHAPSGRKGLPSIQSGVKRLENEDWIGRYHYSQPNRVWHMELFSKADGSVTTLEAPTMEDILSAFVSAQANQTLGNREIEAQNAADEAEEVRRAENPYENALFEFMRDFCEGHELAESVSGLSEEDAQKLFRIIRSSHGGYGLPILPDNLAVVYNKLLDSHSEFVAILDKGLKQAAQNEIEEAQRESEELANAQQAADEEAAQASEEEQFTRNQQDRIAADDLHYLRKIADMKDLKALAYEGRFAGKIQTVPSRGTAKRGN